MGMSKENTWREGHEGQHPDLHQLCIIDTGTLQRIIPNAEPITLENDYFTIQIMLLIRTPDVDTPDKTPPTLSSMAQATSEYMRGRLRRFEFQFRVNFKKVPTGPIFLGCEVERKIKLGRITKGLTSFLLAMIRRINSGFHYSWGVDKKTTNEDLKEGNYEKTHLSFPVEASMDRIVITKPGETPPELGQELPETDASVKRRRKSGAGCIQWNCDDTYTMCLWSAYVDWIEWKCMNVVGVMPFPLGVVLGTQPITLCVYEIKNISNADYKKQKPPHLRKSMEVFTRLEFSHLHKTEGGLSATLLGDQPIAQDSVAPSEIARKIRSECDTDIETDIIVLDDETASTTSNLS